MSQFNEKALNNARLEEAGGYSVAGILVHAKPENRRQVTDLLEAMQGVEVHLTNPDGKLVVTVEELPGEKFIIDRITQINNSQGVISAALVFSQSEVPDISQDYDDHQISTRSIEEPL